jgi:hypothetical protein
MKLPVIVAALTSGRADWRAIDAAITRSDNDAALALWDALDDGPAEVETVLRRAGDAETALEREPDLRGWSSFGRTVWSLEAAATFYEGGYEVIQAGIVGDAVIALAAIARDFEAAKELASKHVPQHPNAPQLRATGE